MDFSRLDSLVSSVCVPGEWRVEPMASGFAKERMEDLIEKKNISKKSNFEIPIVKIVTPEMKMELAAIKLRRFAYKDKFMKSADTRELPTRFQIGTMVGGGMRAVGGGSESQAANAMGKKGAKRGKTHLMDLMHDETVKAWLQKNIEKRTRVARPKTKHAKVTRRSFKH